MPVSCRLRSRWPHRVTPPNLKVWRDGKTIDLTAKLGGVPARPTW